MGQAKRKSKEGFRDLTRTEREHAQVCLHEASHAVIAIMNGMAVRFLAVFKGKTESPAYVEWFYQTISDVYSDHPSMEDFYVVYQCYPGACVCTGNERSSFKKEIEQLSNNDNPEDQIGITEGLAVNYAPTIIERRTPWIDKTKVGYGLTGDESLRKLILDAHPEYKERFPSLKGKTIWEALLIHDLSFKHVSQSIEVIGRAAEQTNYLDAETLLTLVLNETERVINVAQETDDFFIDSAQDCYVPFERVKAEVLEMALGASRRLLSLLNTSNGITDMDLITRHDKWAQEYEELMRKNGPTIYFNLSGH